MSLAKRTLAASIAALGLASGCRNTDLPGPDLERMIDQERADPYEPSEFFADGKVMQNPPEGTVAHDEAPLAPALAYGFEGGAYIDHVPIPVTRDLVRRGQERFHVYCACCHGVSGDGDSWVARRMTLRKPPSLVDARVRAFPPGRIYEVIHLGYGLMRPYAVELSIPDRWAVVAYVRALGLTAGVPIDTLPAPLRARAEEQLR